LIQKPGKGSICFISILLILSTGLIYAQIGGHEFLVYDDDEYVTANAMVKNGITVEGIQWAFTAFHSSNWHPLTWLSHMLDCELFGLNAGAHLLVNLAFHLINALLLYRLLMRMTGAIWQCGFVAVLFALHPLHVESVAWVAERKDLLSTLFGLSALWAYSRYTAKRRLIDYMAVFGCFAASLMAKPMLVTLPCMLLLFDFWPLNRMVCNPQPAEKFPGNLDAKRQSFKPIQKLLLEKIPFFLLTFLSCGITYWAQHAGESVVTVEGLPLGMRITNALWAYAGYITKTIIPAPLAVFYPFNQNLGIWHMVCAALLLIGITYLVVKRWRQHPYLPVGWFWFLGTLVPVIGLVQVGGQAMADRYTYFPMIGLLIMAAWGTPHLIGNRVEHLVSKRILWAFSAMTIVAAMLLSWYQVGRWQNSITLFTHALTATKDNYVAHINLGSAFIRARRYADAIYHCDRALEINPNLTDALYNRGCAYYKIGQPQKAIDSLLQAISLYPGHADTHNNIGLAYADLGQYDQAIAHFTRSIQLQPTSGDFHANLGNTLAKNGNPPEALSAYEKGLTVAPDHTGCHLNRGLLLANRGHLDAALESYRNVMALDPNDSRPHSFAGVALFQMQRPGQAETAFRQALALNPNDADACLYLGRINAARRKMDKARRYFDMAVSLRPSDAEAQYQIGVLLAIEGRLPEAIDQFSETVRIAPKHIGARRNVIQAYWMSGDQDRAFQELEILRAIHPDASLRVYRWMMSQR
jgi:tetratricopeptide (TPR) repeat protein